MKGKERAFAQESALEISGSPAPAEPMCTWKELYGPNINIGNPGDQISKECLKRNF